MKKYYPFIVSFIVLSYVAITGFECASSEMTSAKVYIQQKDYEKAIAFLQKEVVKNPKSDEGYYLMGALYGEKENYEGMVDAFNKSLGISNRFEKDIKNARKKYWVDSFNKGLGFFKKATNAASKDSAKIMFEKSAAGFNQAIAIEPDSADGYKNLSYVYINMENYDAAIAPLKKMIAVNKSVEGYRVLGQIYYNKGIVSKTAFDKSKATADSVTAQNYFGEAITLLEAGKTLYPMDSEILLYLSNSYIAANKALVAMGTFKAGVDADPNNKFYRYNYGVLLIGAGKFEEAEDQFKKALDIDPDYLNAQYNLAITYVKWGAQLQKIADESNKENPEIKAKFRLAIKPLEAYVQKKTDDAAVWELLGKVYSVLSMPNDAKTAFDKADAIRKQ